MKDIQDMTNEEFMEYLMTGHSVHGQMIPLVIMDCLTKGLDHYLQNKERLIREYQDNNKKGNLSFINVEAWIDSCEEIKDRINNRYNK